MTEDQMKDVLDKTEADAAEMHQRLARLGAAALTYAEEQKISVTDTVGARAAHGAVMQALGMLGANLALLHAEMGALARMKFGK